MKIFNNEDIRAIDRATIENEGVSPLQLIERVPMAWPPKSCADGVRPNRPPFLPDLAITEPMPLP